MNMLQFIFHHALKKKSVLCLCSIIKFYTYDASAPYKDGYGRNVERINQQGYIRVVLLTNSRSFFFLFTLTLFQVSTIALVILQHAKHLPLVKDLHCLRDLPQVFHLTKPIV